MAMIGVTFSERDARVDSPELPVVQNCVLSVAVPSLSDDSYSQALFDAFEAFGNDKVRKACFHSAEVMKPLSCEKCMPKKKV
jgi:hypothetical protein